MKMKNNFITLIVLAMLLNLVPLQPAFSQTIDDEATEIVDDYNDYSDNGDDNDDDYTDNNDVDDYVDDNDDAENDDVENDYNLDNGENGEYKRHLQELEDAPIHEVSSSEEIIAIINNMANNEAARIVLTQDIEAPSSPIVLEGGRKIVLSSNQSEHWAMTKIEGTGPHFVAREQGTTLVLENIIIQSQESREDPSRPTTVNRGGIVSGSPGAGATIIVDGAIIRNNGSTGHVSALHLANRTTFIMYSGQIYNNGNGQSTLEHAGGGAMSLMLGSTATIYGGEFHSNVTPQMGGAIFVSGSWAHTSALNIYGGRFYNNSAAQGGAFLVSLNAIANVMGGEFIDNIATYGGAFYLDYFENAHPMEPIWNENYLGIHDGVRIINNHSRADGGAIYNALPMEALDISSGVYFARNTAGNGAHRPPETRPVNINSATTTLFDHPLNNFDVAFTEGDAYTLEDVAQITIDAQQNREITINRILNDLHYTTYRDLDDLRINFPLATNVHLNSENISVNLPNEEWSYQIDDDDAEQITVTIQIPYEENDDDDDNGDNNNNDNDNANNNNDDNGNNNNNDNNNANNNNDDAKNNDDQLIQTGMNTVAVLLLVGLAVGGLGIAISLRKKANNDD